MSLPNLSSLRSNFALRIQRQLTGWAGMKGQSHPQGGGDLTRDGANQDQAGELKAPQAGQAFEHVDASPIANNEDVWRQNFKRQPHGLIHNIRTAARKLPELLKQLRDPQLTLDEKLIMIQMGGNWKPQDIEERRAQREEDQLLKFHIQQARMIKPQIVEVLTRLGFCYSVTHNERKIIKSRIQIGRVDVTPYAYTYYVTRLPFGVKSTEMSADWVATELAVTLRRKVRHQLDQNWGLRYTVEIGSTLSIPNFVEFRDIDKMPKNMPPLAFWAGSSTNGNPVYRNLAEAPHLLIAGSTGGGKSNMLNGIIATFLIRQPASVIKMVFFDLKGGVEFGAFEGIPQLWHSGKHGEQEEKCDGIIEFPHQVLPALEALSAECDRRLAKIKESKGRAKNISEYNRGKHPSNKIPYLVVFFDEWATTKKLVGEKAETLLSNIANLARATGIHFILATQYPKAEIINTAISVNFPWRLAFNMSNAASQSVLGNWNAFGQSPTGRAIFQTNGNEVTVQSPRITNSSLLAIVEAVKSGGIVNQMASVDAEDLLRWALEHAAGKLDTNTLYGEFKGKISDHALTDLLKSMDNQIFDVDGTLYRINPPRAANARRMELVRDEDSVPESPDDAQRATRNAESGEQPIAEIQAPLLGPCPFCGGPRTKNPCEFCRQAEEE